MFDIFGGTDEERFWYCKMTIKRSDKVYSTHACKLMKTSDHKFSKDGGLLFGHVLEYQVKDKICLMEKFYSDYDDGHPRVVMRMQHRLKTFMNSVEHHQNKWRRIIDGVTI